MERITKFLEVYKRLTGLATHMAALKVLVNEGTHEPNVDHLDLINAFVLLEHVIEHTYDPREEKLKDISTIPLKPKSLRREQKKAKKCLIKK